MSLETITSAWPASAASCGKRGPAAKVEDGDRRESGDEFIDVRPVLGRADGEEPRSASATARRATSAKCDGGQRFVSQRAPRLSPSRGRGTPARACRAQSTSAALTASEPPGRETSAPNAAATESKPIDRVRLVQPAAGDDPVRVEPGRPFAGVGEPDAHGGPGRRRHDPRPEQPLEVDVEVETGSAQLPRNLPKLRGADGARS